LDEKKYVGAIPGKPMPRYRVAILEANGDVLEVLGYYDSVEEAAKHPRHAGKRFALMDGRKVIGWP
jgi:hypothetical protein